MILPLIKLKNVIIVVWLDGYTQKLFERRHIFQLAPQKLISNPPGWREEGGEQCQLCLAFSKGRSNQLLPIAKTSSPVQTLFYVYIPNMGTLDFIFRLCQLFLPVKHRYFPILVGFFPSGAHSYLPTRAK